MSFRLDSKLIVLSILLLCVPAPAGAATGSSCLPDHPSGASVYRICLPVPPPENPDLVVFAHGYVAQTEPAGIPEDQLQLPDGTSIPGLINSLGFAFAVSSFPKNGLVKLDGSAGDAVEDMVNLVNYFKSATGKSPRYIYMTGVSEGALVAAKAVETRPDVFDGGLAACGPIGDFRRQLDYVGDTRVVFDYFFPGLLPGPAVYTPSNPPPDITASWPAYQAAIAAALAAKPGKTAQLLSVANIATGGDPANIPEAVLWVLWYNVFGAKDAYYTLGGQPFDNRFRWYSGSANDLALNFGVKRFRADAAALETVKKYQTSGRLSIPLVTIHNTSDPVVPYWHEVLYGTKVAASFSGLRYAHVPVLRYGHCNFTQGEVLLAFGLLVWQVAGW